MKLDKNIIPIVFSLGEDFTMPTSVAITSLLYNANETTFYDIYLFVTKNFGRQYRDKLNSLKTKFNNFNITYIEIDNEFEDVKVNVAHIKKPTYYRLLIPKILTNYKKCIYLDGDVIVEKDLKELYSIELDDKYVAGVKAIGYHFLPDKGEEYCQKIGLPYISDYINVGVLLFNLELIRKNEISKIIEDEIKKNKNFPSDDQDVLNLTCYNYIKHLPFKYNVMVNRVNESRNDLNKVFLPEEIKQAIEYPIIIHFANARVKPWENIRCIFANNWWKYALISPFKDELKKLMEKIEKEVDIIKLINTLKKEKTIILFGYSEIGKKIYDILYSNGVNNIVCFCDNDEKKQNKLLEIPVFPISEALAKYPDSCILITSQNYYRDIKVQLLQMGISTSKIYRYIMKDYEYYKALDSKYYETEVEERGLIDTGRKLRLKEPENFNEKVNWLKLYERKREKTVLSDKFLVREQVINKIGEKYLIPLLGVYNNFDEIDFDKLPNSFVIKANHGSGWNIIVKNKNFIDKYSIKQEINHWLITNYAYMLGLEFQYLDISRKIIIEKYMADKNGELFDYKFLCFNGKVEYCWADIDRYTNHTRNVYDRNWNKQNFTITFQNSDREIKKPDNFEEMIEIAEKLSRGFKHVRIDLYNVDGKIYFGEYTFTSCNGNEIILPYEYNVKLGNLITI